MTRTAELGLLAGTQKVARPWCTAIETGFPTDQNALAVVSLCGVRGGSTHPAETSNPTRDAKTHGHTRSLESERRTKRGSHHELRRTDLPALAAIVTRTRTTAFRSDLPVDRLESTAKTLSPRRKKGPKLPTFRRDCQKCSGEAGPQDRQAWRTLP